MSMKNLQMALLYGVLTTSSLLAACNTVEGMGEDMQSAGEAVEDTADDAND